MAAPPGDVARGARIAMRLCAQCHALLGGPPPPRDAQAVGPALTGVGGRLDPGALRLAVVNLAIAAPHAEGHAFYDLPPFDPDATGRPETVLTAAEVEDVVAWLAAQTR
jgi:sulfur-oxidizing protein SoxX